MIAKQYYVYGAIGVNQQVCGVAILRRICGAMLSAKHQVHGAMSIRSKVYGVMSAKEPVNESQTGLWCSER